MAEERAHEGLCCAIFARRVQIVGEKILRLLFPSMFLAAHRPRADESFSSTDTPVISRENFAVRENYADRSKSNRLTPCVTVSSVVM